MKKMFFDSKLAKLILAPGYGAITLGPCFFAKRPESALKPTTKYHENIHIMQWFEITMVAALVFWLCQLLFGCSVWFGLLVPFMFNILYSLEYVVRWIKKGTKAYYWLSFEQEAYRNETIEDYLVDREYFSWLKYMFKEPTYTGRK